MTSRPTRNPAPAEVFCFADFLSEELRERKWSTRDLALRCNDLPVGFTLLPLNYIVVANPDQLVIDGRIMQGIARALGVSVEFLRSLERGWFDHPDRRKEYLPDLSVCSAPCDEDWQVVVQ